jgi:subtilisin family serine protease
MTSSLLGGGIITLAGTSYATPVVSACAAALLEASPGATPAQLTAALRTSGTLVVDTTNGLAFPRLSCRKALRTLVPDVPALPGVRPVLVVATLLLLLGGAGALRGASSGSGGSRGSR